MHSGAGHAAILSSAFLRSVRATVWGGARCLLRATRLLPTEAFQQTGAGASVRSWTGGQVPVGAARWWSLLIAGLQAYRSSQELAGRKRLQLAAGVNNPPYGPVGEIDGMTATFTSEKQLERTPDLLVLLLLFLRGLYSLSSVTHTSLRSLSFSSGLNKGTFEGETKWGFHFI